MQTLLSACRPHRQVYRLLCGEGGVSPRLSLRRKQKSRTGLLLPQKSRVHLVIEEGTATDHILQGQDMSHEEMYGSLREQMTEHM